MPSNRHHSLNVEIIMRKNAYNLQLKSELSGAMVKLTTVGYGDVYPITVGEKIFTTIVLMIGLGLIAIPVV